MISRGPSGNDAQTRRRVGGDLGASEFASQCDRFIAIDANHVGTHSHSGYERITARIDGDTRAVLAADSNESRVDVGRHSARQASAEREPAGTCETWPHRAHQFMRRILVGAHSAPMHLGCRAGRFVDDLDASPRFAPSLDHRGTEPSVLEVATDLTAYQTARDDYRPSIRS